MSKLLHSRPPGTVTLVETPVSVSYARKARIAFVAVGAAAGVLVSAVLSTVVDPVPAIAFGILTGGLCGLLAAMVVRAWPVLRVLWHWAGELVLAVVIVAPATLLGLVSHPLVPLALAVVLGVVLAIVRPVRRWLLSWGWCVVDRHRLRLCFAEFIRSANRVSPGRLPLILIARPTPAGERVWVWLRPGLDLTDLDGKTSKLAVTCWAAEVRVVRASARHAALIRVDIARRDPLLGLIASPLAGLIPEDVTWSSAVPPSMATLGLALDLPDVPNEVPKQRTPGRR